MTLQLIHSSRPAVQRDRLIRLPEVEALTGCKKSTIYLLMKDGRFPRHVALAARHVAWSENAVLQWVQDRINNAHVEPLPANINPIRRLQQVLDTHSDAQEIAAALETERAPQRYYIKEAAIHIRSLDCALREILATEEGGAA